MKVYELIRKLAQCDPMKDVQIVFHGNQYMFDTDGNEHLIKFENENFDGIDSVYEHTEWMPDKVDICVDAGK